VTSLDKKMEGVVAEFIAGNLTGGNLVVLNQRDLARRMASSTTVAFWSEAQI
jgi:hypothetical protein